jgi:D-glycero-D-manno-heptose 1,7-bisphosphate phosphatase
VPEADNGPLRGPDTLRRAAFIDRDGVIIEERGFAWRPEDLVLLPGAAAALEDLQSAGFLLVVVTNQSGIARGLYTEADYELFTARMRARLADLGVRLDAVEHCPHLPDAALARYRRQCDCRKPQPGMLRRAMAALAIDAATSLLVGDRATDVAAGRAAGVGLCLLVRSGQALTADDESLADGVYDDLAACVRAQLAK